MMTAPNPKMGRTKFWTKERIESEVTEVARANGRFPTNSELVSRGRGDLVNQISRSGGFRFWAKKLGIDSCKSDSDFGWAGEVESKKIIEAAGFSCERISGVKSPFDLSVDGVLRVDVKTANYMEYGACRGWFYRIAKIPQADLIFLYQFDTREFVAVPWWLCPSTNITISRGGGKYAKFMNNWTVVRNMVDNRKSEILSKELCL